MITRMSEHRLTPGLAAMAVSRFKVPRLQRDVRSGERNAKIPVLSARFVTY